jgi:hypothetical protein
VPGHVADEALLGLVVEDFLSEVARGVEVFWADLGEEGHGFAYEMAMRLVESTERSRNLIGSMDER